MLRRGSKALFDGAAFLSGAGEGSGRGLPCEEDCTGEHRSDRRLHGELQGLMSTDREAVCSALRFLYYKFNDNLERHVYNWIARNRHCG